jgi:hypothetical protein
MGQKRILRMSLFLFFFILLTSVPDLAKGDPLEFWQRRNPFPHPYPLYGVNYGGGTFVAVGRSGTILTSPDGVTWMSRTSGTPRNLWGITYGNNTFVAVGDGDTILTSPDGVIWTPRVSGTANDLLGVTYGNGFFVAVGYPGAIFTSPDGVTWTPRSSGSSNYLYGVSYGNNTFVAVGSGGIILTSTSPDGANWTAEDSGTSTWFNVVTYGNNTFIIVGDGGTILQSDLTGFDDVPVGHWARDFIMALYQTGITGGCAAHPPMFCPESAISRGQMAVFLEAALEHPPNLCTGRFTDVSVGDPFCGFIERLADDGITGGCGGTEFCPSAPVTRGQMAVFLEASLGNGPNRCMGQFADVPLTDLFCGFIERLAADGITGGCGEGNFCPNAPVTRAQMAVFLTAASPLGYSISGTVYYSTTPLPNVRVELIQGSLSNPPMASMLTDSSGDFAFAGLEGGDYYVKVYGPNSDYIYASASLLTMTTSSMTLPYYLRKKMTLLSPANGSTVDTVTFCWQGLPEAARYTFQMNKTSDWTLIAFVHDIMGTCFQLTTPLENNVDYTWQIDAADQFGHEVGSTVDAFRFFFSP